MSTQKQDLAGKESHDANRDPLTGEKGAHPVGVGGGALGGGLAGGAIGAVGGPIGAAVGVVAGAIAGGLAGKAVAEEIDPTVEDAYWRDHYHTRPYVAKGTGYDHYQHAYSYGWEARAKHRDKSFDQVEKDLRSTWSVDRPQAGYEWEKAKPAVRDAWDRFENV